MGKMDYLSSSPSPLPQAMPAFLLFLYSALGKAFSHEIGSCQALGDLGERWSRNSGKKNYCIGEIPRLQEVVMKVTIKGSHSRTPIDDSCSPVLFLFL